MRLSRCAGNSYMTGNICKACYEQLPAVDSGQEAGPCAGPNGHTVYQLNQGYNCVT